MADLAIITLSKARAYFERLADSLDAQSARPTAPVVERILVNNANSVELTQSAVARGWLVVEPGYNTSFSAGNNMAAKVTGAQTLLLLNDDLLLREDFLASMWGDDGPEADITGALLLHTDGTINHAGTLVEADTMTGGIYKTDHIGRGAPGDSPHASGTPLVNAATFAAAMVKRPMWDRLGGLDERYYYGWEDTDFCLRALRAGATIRCCRDAVATHNECGTRPRGGRYDIQNGLLFQETWAGQVAEVLRVYAARAPGPIEGGP